MTAILGIETREVLGTGYFHTYLVYQADSMANWEALHGFDNNDILDIFHSPDLSNTIPIAENDERGGTQAELDARGHTQITTGQAATDKWSIMKQHVLNLDAAQLDYELTLSADDQNSNATVASILHSVGLNIDDYTPFTLLPGPVIVDNDDLPGYLNNLLNVATTLTGSSNNDTINGGDQNDSLSGNEGNDVLDGKLGDDTLIGGDGNDAIVGDNGDDELFGNDGNDDLLGSTGNDTLHADGGNDMLTGGAGNDLYIIEDDYFASDISTIFGYETNNFDEWIDLSDIDAINTFADLIITPSGSDAIVDFGTGQQIVLDNISVGSLDDTDFRIGAPLHQFFQVNTTTANTQDEPAITTLNDGSFIVTWSSSTSGVIGPSDIYGQRFTANGAKIGNEFLVNTTITDYQYDSQISALDTGGFVVSWTSGDDGVGINKDIHAQIYNQSGNKVGGEILVNTTTQATQQSSTVTTLSNGNFIVAWEGSGSSAPIYGQIITPNGAFVGNELTLSDPLGFGEGDPSIEAFSSGGFVMVWEQEEFPSRDLNIYGQRYDNSGVAIGSEFIVNTTTVRSQQHADVGVLNDGGFVVVWDGDDAQFRDDIYGQRFDASGNPVGNEFFVNTTTVDDQTRPSVTGLNDGGFVVLWNDIPASELHGQRYSADGSTMGSEFTVPFFLGTSVLEHPAVTLLDDGNLAVSTGSPSGGGEIFAVIMDSNIGYYTYGTPNTENINGTAGADAISALAGDDTVNGNGGNDTLFGGKGLDSLLGGSGDDIINGERSADRLEGGVGNDTLNGGDGRDILFGDQDNDELHGNEDHDIIFAGDDSDVLYGEEGDDGLHGENGNDTLYGGEGEDFLNSSDGDDFLYGGGDYDLMTGGIGNDMLYGDSGNDIMLGDADNDTLYGGTGNDALFGGTGYDSLNGNNGNDTLNGEDGDDTLFGQNDSDSLLGQAGDDSLDGGSGADTLEGGTGNDTLIGGGGTDSLEGGDNDDSIEGNDGADTIYGNDGNDFLSGQKGIDVVYGGEGNDTIYGGKAADSLYGEGGNDLILGDNNGNSGGQQNPFGTIGIQDSLFGGDGADTLQGMGAADQLNGEADSDILTGGSGKDEFIFTDLTHSTDTNIDTITDFEQGDDRITLTGLGITSIAELSITNDGTNTTIDHNFSTFAIKLNGVFTLTASDFEF